MLLAVDVVGMVLVFLCKSTVVATVVVVVAAEEEEEE